MAEASQVFLKGRGRLKRTNYDDDDDDNGDDDG